MVLQSVGNKKYSFQVAYVIAKLVTWFIVETGNTTASSLKITCSWIWVEWQDIL